MLEEQTKTLGDYVDAIRRRRVAIAVTGGTLFVIAALVAFLLPPVYQSSATILIKEQEIPSDLVRSTVTTYAWQRVQIISQQVMTRDNLMRIVQDPRYDLYAAERRRKTTEEVIERMRKDIKVEPISADVIDPRSGKPMPAIIAFKVSFHGESPGVTQKVASELATLYLRENVKTRTEKATEAYDFLTEEAAKLDTQIAELAGKLAEFKEENINQLPELAQVNMSLLDRTERELIDTMALIRSLEERRLYIDGQLALTNPSGPLYSPSGERVLDAQSRLKVLKNEYAAATARYAPDHPDVQRLAREIEGVEAQAGAVSQTNELAKRVTQLRTELANARKRYSDEHPDVKRLTRELGAQEAQLAASRAARPESVAGEDEPDNPAYITLKTQLETVDSQLRSYGKKRDDLRQKLASLEQRAVQAPQVEREYMKLKRDYDTAQLRFQEIKKKQAEADVAKQLEQQDKGERFALIDPPQYPEKPIKPNRFAILMLGLILSIGGGIGYAMVAESVDTSVRGTRGVIAALGAAPLSVIPYVENSADILQRAKYRKLALRSALAGLAAAVVLVQFFWIPWDVLWFKGLRVLGNLIGS